MKQFLGKSLSGLFATQTLTGHVIRGAVGVCPALPCIRAAAFAPCRIVVGGFAGVGGYARLPGLLDDRAGRNHSTALWGDSKLREGEVGMNSQRVSGTAAQRTIAVLGSAVFFVVAPCTLAGLVPWSITGWQLQP